LLRALGLIKIFYTFEEVMYSANLLDIQNAIIAIREWMDTDIAVVEAFISLVIGLITQILFIYKWFLKVKLNKKHKYRLRDFGIIALYLLVGVVVPLLCIFHSWPSNTFLIIMLKILSWYMLFSFCGLLYIVWSFSRILKDTVVIDENSKV